MAADWIEEKGAWKAMGNGPGEAILATGWYPYPPDSLGLCSRQDCEDLIALLERVKERLLDGK